MTGGEEERREERPGPREADRSGAATTECGAHDSVARPSALRRWRSAPRRSDSCSSSRSRRAGSSLRLLPLGSWVERSVQRCVRPLQPPASSAGPQRRRSTARYPFAHRSLGSAGGCLSDRVASGALSDDADPSDRVNLLGCLEHPCFRHQFVDGCEPQVTKSAFETLEVAWREVQRFDTRTVSGAHNLLDDLGPTSTGSSTNSW